ncbi:MlaD family protein [Flavobacterium degerlachei]|jgi:phospholipid/cholesterol/gamma-HCH transport system substrate-binding protein|uniref:Phospholipid/cholesterol/gamma-HCH transport system substrate-binding protein n=1 Tax=Flavobacterium degerlachei TaxID=229203 RepID=A0A1H2STA1_9FLAO|nr:MlaD family protein [Flavobacterium degerlachei]SDW34820.1 phospholipid/cholesterol/gamma-HCH transport system substrate-binding protein [Flavobacterium degerlachei]
MEKTTTQKIRLGLFVIIGLLIFVLATYLIGDKQKMFGNTVQLATSFNNVNGLQLGNNVRYSGVNVGTVRNIEMIGDTNIRVEMIIDKEIFKHIKKNAVATIGSDGLVGSMVINILPGKGMADLVEPGYEISSLNRIRTDDLLNTFSKTNKNAEQLTENLLKITNEINDGEGTVGLLVNDIAMAKDLKLTMSYLKVSSQKTSESISNLNRLIATLNNKDNVVGILKDTAVANRIRNIVGNLDNTSIEINKAVSNVNKTVLNIKDGKGALNYLSNDPGLVRKIDSTMTNVNEASIRLNEDLEALKHNFLFRGYFRKLEREKLREQKK